MKKQEMTYRKLLKYASGNTKYYILLTLCLGIKNLESLISPLLVSRIVDEAIAGKRINIIILYSLSAIVLYMISGMIVILLQGITTKIERKIVLNVRGRCIQSLLQKTGVFYTNQNSSDILTLFMQDIECISNMLSEQMISAIYNIILIIAISIFLMCTSWKMTIIVYVTLFVLLILQRKLSGKIEIVTSESRESAIALQKPIQELASNSLSIVLGNLGIFQQKKIKENEKKFEKIKMKTAITIAEYGATISFLSGVLVILIICIGGIQVINKVMSIGTLLAFDIYTQRLLSPLTNLSNLRADMAAVKISYDRVEQYLIEENQKHGYTDYIASEGSDIIFENVTFSYNDKENILDKMSCHIKKGEVHAFVGESGAGKSTIVNLIYGLWTSKAGCILINGKKIQEYTIESLRKKISIVSQNVFLLDDTIYNNIVLDDPNPNKEKVKEALFKAKILDYVEGLEQGWESRIGENGVRLSGGEKQRMAIARAIYRDSDILIFDEATSMLDNETESLIIQQALNIFKGKTVLMIAHRLSTVKGADCISVVSHGKVIEEGTHEELLNLKGKYHALYQYQN